MRIFKISHTISERDIMKITFPKNEWDNIKDRLENNKNVYTIRVSDETNKYHKNDVLLTELGDPALYVRVLSVKKIHGGIEELKKVYKYFDSLTSEMINELRDYQDMEIINLKKEDWI